MSQASPAALPVPVSTPTEKTVRDVMRAFRTASHGHHDTRRAKRAALRTYLGDLQDIVLAPDAFEPAAPADYPVTAEKIRDQVEETIEDLLSSIQGDDIAFALDPCQGAFYTGLGAITVGALFGGPAGAAAGFFNGLIALYVSCRA